MNKPNHFIKSDIIIFFAFAFAVTATRLPSFHRSVLDWDESVYFLMAEQWRLGQLPYTVIWDNKPLGIYAIFAVFQSIFGNHIAAMRVATIATVTLLAFTVTKITETFNPNRAAAIFAGAAVILCSLSNDGLAANTELFMATCTALAVLAALTTENALLVGLLLGCAFMIKYVAIFEAPVIFFLLLRRHPRPRTAIAMLAGAAVPLAATMLLYAQAHQLTLWYDCSIESNFRRAAAPLTSGAFLFAARTQLWRWGPLYAAALLLILRGQEKFIIAWLIAGLLGAAAAKSFYDHYFLQILPVLGVILGLTFARLSRHRAAFALAVLALPALAAWNAERDALNPDIPAQIAAALTEARAPSLYVFDSEPILYALTKLNPPTLFVLPSELRGTFLPTVAGVDAQAEVARILATRPAYIVTRVPPQPGGNPAIYAELDQALATAYAPWRSFYGTEIYRRIRPAAAP